MPTTMVQNQPASGISSPMSYDQIAAQINAARSGSNFASMSNGGGYDTSLLDPALYAKFQQGMKDLQSTFTIDPALLAPYMPTPENADADRKSVV